MEGRKSEGGGVKGGGGEWEESELNGFECLLKSTKWRSAEGGGGELARVLPRVLTHS